MTVLIGHCIVLICFSSVFFQTEPSAVEQPSPSLDVPTPTTDPKKPGLSSQLLSTLLQSKAEVQPELQTTQLATTTTSPAAKPIKAELPLDDPAAVEDLLHVRRPVIGQLHGDIQPD